MSFKIYTREGVIDALPFSKSVIALGTFDGVHAAHSSLLSLASSRRDELGEDVGLGVWCFSEAPLAIIRGEEAQSIFPLEEKISMLLENKYAEGGRFDFVAVADFNAYRNLSAEDFVDEVLISRLGCAVAVCGFNHRFGKKGAGDDALLRSRLGDDNVIVVNPLKVGEELVSSTSIRKYISEGDMEAAGRMLLSPYHLKSEIVRGKMLGRKLNFPTANQFFHKGCVVPKHGIYATKCIIDGEAYLSVSNVGIRPTITDGSDNHRVNCETYVIGFAGDLYGKTVTVNFYKYLRGEQKFDTIEELYAQVERDKEASIAYFQNNKINQ